MSPMLPTGVYLDTSLLTAASFVRATSHQAALQHLSAIKQSTEPVFISPLVKSEYLQSLRTVATIPGLVSGTVRRRFRLQHWGSSYDVRSQWLAAGLASLDDLLAQFADAFNIPITDAAIRRSMSLMAQHHLKSYDALHVSCALEAGVPKFATVDADFVRISELTVHLVRDTTT